MKKTIILLLSVVAFAVLFSACTTGRMNRNYARTATATAQELATIDTAADTYGGTYNNTTGTQNYGRTNRYNAGQNYSGNTGINNTGMNNAGMSNTGMGNTGNAGTGYSGTRNYTTGRGNTGNYLGSNYGGSYGNSQNSGGTRTFEFTGEDFGQFSFDEAGRGARKIVFIFNDCRFDSNSLPSRLMNQDTNRNRNRTGNTGNAGNMGYTNNMGNTGNMGTTGNTGISGIAGNTGNTGTMGNTGNTGYRGGNRNYTPYNDTVNPNIDSYRGRTRTTAGDLLTAVDYDFVD